MRRLESSVPHRLGRRTSFIPSLHGSSAKWAEVIDAADDPARRTAIGSAVVATLLVAGPDGQPVVETADVTALKAIVPDQLFAVRRPRLAQGDEELHLTGRGTNRTRRRPGRVVRELQ